MRDIVERACELAKSGTYLSITEIREALHRKGYTYGDLRALTSPSVRQLLRTMIVTARQDQTRHP